jgi:hypothetical protein
MATIEQPTNDSQLETPVLLSDRVSSEASTMPQQETEAAPKLGLMTRLHEEIDPSHSDLPVLATCFVSGICDSVAFNASSVFVSMQTGQSLPASFPGPREGRSMLATRPSLPAIQGTPSSSLSVQQIFLTPPRPSGSGH